MTKKKSPIVDDAAQSGRFIEAAKGAGIEKVGKEFDRALGKLAPAKKAAGSPKRAKRS